MNTLKIKEMTLIATLLVTACGRGGNDHVTGKVTEVDPITPDTSCAVYDACTYTGGWDSHPVYNCQAKTYRKTEVNIPEEYFEGHSCLTTKEDFRQVPGMCGMPGMQFPCMVWRQGPGPLAIPELGL